MTCDFGRDAETEPRRNVPRRYPSRADDPSPARRYPLRKPPPERRDFPELTPKTRPWGLCPPTRSLFSPRGRARTPPARETQPYRSHHPRTRRRTPARSRAARASAAGPRAASTGPPGGAGLRGRAPPREHRRARPDTSRHGRCPRVSRPERVRVRVLAGLDGGTHRGTPGPGGGLRDARGAREVPRGDGDGRRSRVNGNGRGDVRRSRHFWRRGDDRRRRSRQFRERRRRRRVRFRARRSRRVSRRNPGGFQDGDASSEFLHLGSFRAGDRLRARGGVQ